MTMDNEEADICRGEIKDLLDLSDDELSDWEIEFTESISEWLDSKGFLTERQADKLHETWDDHCGNGGQGA